MIYESKVVPVLKKIDLSESRHNDDARLPMAAISPANFLAARQWDRIDYIIQRLANGQEIIQFTWKIEWRLVSSSRGCLCAYPKRSRGDVFQRSSTNLSSHVLSLARQCEGRNCSQEDASAYRAPSARPAKRIHRPESDGRTVRMTPTWSGHWRGIFERSPRDLKRRSITWIVNPVVRSFNSLTVVRGAP